MFDHILHRFAYAPVYRYVTIITEGEENEVDVKSHRGKLSEKTYFEIDMDLAE